MVKAVGCAVTVTVFVVGGCDIVVGGCDITEDVLDVTDDVGVGDVECVVEVLVGTAALVACEIAVWAVLVAPEPHAVKLKEPAARAITATLRERVKARDMQTTLVMPLGVMANR